MSNPLPARENASPLVRTDPDVAALGHYDLEVVSHKQPAVFGPVGFASPARIAAFASRPTHKAADEHVAQLSERETIFATHYVTSDSNATTPRLPSTITGSKNDLNQDVTLQFELPGPLASRAKESPLLPWPRYSTTPMTSPFTLTKQLLRSKSDYAKTPQQSIDIHIRDIERRYGGRALNEVSASIKDIERPSATNPDKHRPSKIRSQTGYTLRMSAAWTQSDAGDRSPQGFSNGSGRHREGEKGKSSSDQTPSSEEPGHPEHQIEATLASDETIPNVRSRKASHYLGIFKNNNTQELKTYKDRAKDNSRAGRAQVPDSRSNSGIEWLEQDILPKDNAKASGTTRVTRHNISGGTKQAKILKTQPQLIRKESNPNSSQPLLDISNSTQTRTRVFKKEPTQDDESIEWRSERPSQGTLPLRLLEEIRNHGSFSPSSEWHHRKESEGSLDEAFESKPNVIEDNTLNEGRCRQSIEDEESESDKEHIASATYFPHHTPTLQKPVNHHVPDGENSSAGENGPTEPQTVAFDDSGDDVIHESNDSALVLQSKAKVHYIQKEFQKARPLHELEDYRRTTWSSISSASDTDYDSWDDTARTDGEDGSSLTDNGEITPTATPHTRHNFRAHSTRAPLGAVELKPYKHQVGGHTKVFSFSKQAICKQLNNKENEFYEVIERRHPELLRFLPKYLGVLNVTYQKVHKRKKKRVHGTDLVHMEGYNVEQQNSKATESFVPSKIRERQSELPALRTISRSQNYESQDETVPKVIYANNLHIIPNNLFQSTPQAGHDGRPQTSAGVIPVPRTEPQQDDGATAAAHFNSKRPSLHKSYPSWGATTVNTKFKEKVLREVFSPPHIHQYNRRQRRNNFQSLRIQNNEDPIFQDAPDTMVHNSSTNSSEKSGACRKRLVSGPKGTVEKLRCFNSDQGDWKSGSAPVARDTNVALTILRRVQAIGSECTTNSSNDGKKIRRRRSGGGLRREQVDLENNGRGHFKYFEQEQYGGNKDEEHIFSMDLSPQNGSATKLSMENVERASKILHSRPLHVDGVSHKEAHAALQQSIVSEQSDPCQPHIQGPSNPLEAQQQSDERIRHFLLLEDLTANMMHPCVLDLKMGTRQYGIEATKKKQMSQRQKCKSTTSRQLGVRVCGMQVWNARTKEYTFEDKYAGRDLKAGREFQDALMRFLCDGSSTISILRHIPPLLEKLSKLEKFIIDLPGYRFYASSLLMLYDGQDVDSLPNQESYSKESTNAAREKSGKLPKSNIDVKLVDFANCVTGEDNLPDETPCPPRDRNGVDRGYIRGLRMLRTYLQGVWKEINGSEWVERGEGEAMGLSMKGAGKKRDEPDWWQEGWEDDSGEVST